MAGSVLVVQSNEWDLLGRQLLGRAGRPVLRAAFVDHLGQETEHAELGGGDE